MRACGGQVNVSCLPQSLSTLLFVRESITQPWKVSDLARLASQWSPMHPAVSSSPVLGHRSTPLCPAFMQVHFKNRAIALTPHLNILSLPSYQYKLKKVFHSTGKKKNEQWENYLFFLNWSNPNLEILKIHFMALVLTWKLCYTIFFQRKLKCNLKFFVTEKLIKAGRTAHQVKMLPNKLDYLSSMPGTWQENWLLQALVGSPHVSIIPAWLKWDGRPSQETLLVSSLAV